MPGAPLVDAIGAACTVTRRTEPRIAGQVRAALGDARTVLNAGAGTGSYEPPGRDVTAAGPSAVLRAQRPAAPCLAAAAESLPFQDRSFDAAMAPAATGHGQDPIAGLREMRRAARGVAVLTTDASDPGRSWPPATSARPPTPSATPGPGGLGASGHFAVFSPAGRGLSTVPRPPGMPLARQAGWSSAASSCPARPVPG
jgi:hypothetical protein